MARSIWNSQVKQTQTETRLFIISACIFFFRGIFYPFKLSYWRGSTPRKAAPIIDQLEENGAINKAFEKEPQDKQLGVQLIDVSKVIDRF